MDIESILIQPGDLPAWNVAGEFKLLTGNQPILRNAGNAEFLAIRWICNIENRGEIGGEVRLYSYPTNVLAERFFFRITRDFEGGLVLDDVGDKALIRQGPRLFPMPEPTSIRFLRKRFVVEIVGTSNDDPSFARSKLTREVLVRYAGLLDRRLIALEIQA